MSKIDFTSELKIHGMFSMKALLKQSLQAIAIRYNFQCITVKSNKKVFDFAVVFEDCLWSVRASCCFHGDRSL